MWGIEIVYFLVPLPFTNYKRKAYFLKLLISVLLSPFPFVKSSLPIIWMSEQMVSFSQPISDFFCTAYKIFDINYNCANISDVNLGILVTIFVYRIVQNTKVVEQNNWRLIPAYYGIFRGFFGLITILTSYFYRKYEHASLFIIFVVSAVLSTGGNLHRYQSRLGFAFA